MYFYFMKIFNFFSVCFTIQLGIECKYFCEPVISKISCWLAHCFIFYCLQHFEHLFSSDV